MVFSCLTGQATQLLRHRMPCLRSRVCLHRARRCLASALGISFWHPIKNLETGKVEITSQNHGFAVADDSLPAGVRVTHISLFDGSNEGIACDEKRAFSVQYHPEASPGPSDSAHLFRRFVGMMEGGGVI